MRALFILLLLLNVCYFGWELDRQTRISMNRFAKPLDVPEDSHRLQMLREVGGNAGEIAVASGDDAGSSADSVVSRQMESDTSALQGIVSMMDQGNVAIKKRIIDEFTIGGAKSNKYSTQDGEQKKILCFSFGPFTDGGQADELSEWLLNNKIHHKQRLEKNREEAPYLWIYLAPRETRSEAIAAAEELKKQGIGDYKVINKGNFQNAISLGLFSDQSAVNRRMSELKNVGYQPIIVPHRKTRRLIWVDARVRNQRDILSKIINGYPARFNHVPMDCEAPFIERAGLI